MSHEARPARSRHRGAALTILILAISFLLPVLFVHFRGEDPRARRIHIDLFRYGMIPNTIHAARGDTLILTFSSRDTPQSFFLQEYDLDVKVSPNTGEVEVVRPSDPEGEPEAMREVVIHAGRPGLAGFFVTKTRYRGHVFSGPMHGFEQGFFIVHPNYLFAGAMGLLFGIPIAGVVSIRRRRHAEPPPEPPRGADLFERWPWLQKLLATQGLQFWLMSLAGILMYAVILIALLGTKMAGGNLGILLVWVVWLFALVVLLVPLFGRAWCTVCPIPMVGDAIQRGTATGVRAGSTGITNNRYNGLWLAWPSRLANRVPRVLMFLAFATFSVLIISQPRWTGWALVLLVALGTTMPLFFEHRAFCRYLCPINSFISLYARMGKLSLRRREAGMCDRCVRQEIVTCERGDARGWACPYGLAVHEIHDNAECGLCMECIRTCRYTNISLFWRPFRLDRILSSRDEALQAIVMLTLAVVYCILFQGPWHGLRDMVDLIDKKNVGLFILYAGALWLTALAIAPLIVTFAGGLGAKLAGRESSDESGYALAASALVPMGLFLWIAFAIPMLQVQGSFILSTLSDPFGWGWDLFGTAGYPWIQLLPESIPWIQTVLALIGFSLSLRTAHRAWSGRVGAVRALPGMAPIGAFLLILTAGMVWFFAA